MSDYLRRAAIADLGGLATRHPNLLDPSPWRLVWHCLMVATATMLAVYAVWRLEFSFARFGSGVGQLFTFISLMFPPSPGNQFAVFVAALGETLAIAFLGTLIAATLAFPVGFFAAKNVVPNVVAHFLVRRMLDSIRGVDVLIWALVFINVVGLGPFAGILAIAISDFGTFGKLFSEAIENADQRPLEGITSTGGGALHRLRFAMIPQVIPVILSQVLYYIESNTRAATIIGIVGAGGIGLHLAEQIRVLDWDKVSFLVLMILITVVAIDWVSTRLRFAIIGPANQVR